MFYSLTFFLGHVIVARHNMQVVCNTIKPMQSQFFSFFYFKYKTFQLGFTTLHCSNNWLLGETDAICGKPGCPNSASWIIFWIWSFTKDCFEAGKRLNAGAKLRRNKSTSSSCCSSFSFSLASLVAKYLSNMSSVPVRFRFMAQGWIPGLDMDVPVLVLAGSASLSSSGSSSSTLFGTEFKEML